MAQKLSRFGSWKFANRSLALTTARGRETVRIGGNVRIDEFVHRVGKIHLPGEHIAVVEQHLEMHVRGAAGVPARIDRFETDRTFAIGELRAAEKFLSDGRKVLLVALALVARIDALRIGVPEIDAGALARARRSTPSMTRKVHAAGERRSALGDLRADEPGVEIIRSSIDCGVRKQASRNAPVSASGAATSLSW